MNSRTGWLFPLLACLVAGLLTQRAGAEDWGAYALVPSGAPGMVLEAVGAGTAEGTVVSIGRASGGAHQKWYIVPKGGDLYAIRPSYSATLVLAAEKGGSRNGTPMVLEADRSQPWQLWSLRKNENGTYCVVPKHAPDKGLDDFGGNREPGARQDLWENRPGDGHLQWLVRPLAGTVTPGASTEAGSTYVAPDIKPEAILPGQIKSAPFTRSAIFPGTHRQVTAFIPAQYDGTRPACVYVKFDGYNPNEKSLLERMIATKEMPVTIGVFVTPGDLPAPMKNTLGRRNRDLEYDGMGDKNVRFLTEEILPFVAREWGLKLSTSGNDRCIAGGSSGGIAAFNAAWERPDAFSRVYANSGSFVAFRGGHEFPTLVRKTEAKPIRAYLTTGTRDMENAAGDWFLLDQEMDKALRFSGYDYFFRIINGGHVAGYYEYYQEAMAYLWKGWPQPVQAGPSAPRVRDVLLPEEQWQQVRWSGPQRASAAALTAQREKPHPPAAHDLRGAACNAAGDVFFLDVPANKMYRMGVDGSTQEFLADAGKANSLCIGTQGELYALSSATGKIMRYDPTGKGTLVAAGISGQYVLAAPGGGLYVTRNEAPRKRGKSTVAEETERGEVWFVKDGKQRRVASGLKLATGMAYRPDQWLLAVAEGDSKWATSYQMEADGSLTQGERYFWLHVPDGDDEAGTEAACYAREGQILFATRAGIQICADDGPTQVILPLPDRGRVLSLCLGGREMDTLYAFSGDHIWKRRVKLHGMGAFTPWTAVKGTPL